jgi:predicted metal-dependent HD superfamily phosphohydrolase
MMASEMPSASIDALRERWTALWSAMDLAAPDGMFENLLDRHREPQRHYHTLQHLEECLARLDEMHAHAIHPLEIELALWFHDAVYDVTRHDNEQQSAELARHALQGAGVAADTIERVASLVLGTRHDTLPSGIDAHIVSDADLSILAADAARFDQYQRQIRHEYGHVPEPEFAQKRSAVLAAFLARPSIYMTPAFRARHEYAARANLRRALATG